MPVTRTQNHESPCHSDAAAHWPQARPGGPERAPGHAGVPMPVTRMMAAASDDRRTSLRTWPPQRQQPQPSPRDRDGGPTRRCRGGRHRDLPRDSGSA
jgi:hypothetical protein